MKSFLKTAVSYFWELPVEKVDSQVSGRLEVKMSGGKYILDSPHANYSFGSLHRLFQRIFDKIGLASEPPASVLLLGLGGGSVISILRKEYGLDMPVTAVEADPEVIRLAVQYFQVGQYAGVKVIRGDAAGFVETEGAQYGMIIVDIFVDNNVPESVLRPSFLENCTRILEPGGSLLFNFIKQNPAQSASYGSLLKTVDSLGLSCVEHPIFHSNRVLVIRSRE
jgi:spermidine synthase